jgi:cytochrome c2
MIHHHKKTAIAAALIWIFALPAHAGDAAQGKKLHDAKCFACHDTGIYTRKDSIILSLGALKKRVKFCEGANKVGWNEQQIDDVVAYLNQTFYKYK